MGEPVARPQPLVSVLIPVYNRVDLVSRALESALAQTWEPLEVVVGDNHSDDGTYDVVRSFACSDPRVRCFRNDENLGPIANWARCLETARGGYVKFVFSDDWLDPRAVGALMAPLLADSQVRASYCAAAIHYPDYARMVYLTAPAPRLHLREMLAGAILAETCPVSPGCGLFLRDDVRTALSWVPSTERGRQAWRRGFGPDLLMYLVAAARGPVAPVSQVLAHFLSHAGSLSESDAHDDIVWGYLAPVVDLPTFLGLPLPQVREVEGVLTAAALVRSLRRPGLAGRLLSWRTGAVLQGRPVGRSLPEAARFLAEWYRVTYGGGALRRKLERRLIG